MNIACLLIGHRYRMFGTWTDRETDALKDRTAVVLVCTRCAMHELRVVDAPLTSKRPKGRSR